VYTTRPDTLFGATFMVLAPEHPLVERITTDKLRNSVREYVARARKASDIDRLSTEREKSGVATGAFAHQSHERREDSDLGRGLRAHDVWDRRDHGGAGARREGL